MSRHPFAVCGICACGAALLGSFLCKRMPDGLVCLIAGLFLLTVAVIARLFPHFLSPVFSATSGRLQTAATAASGLVLCILFAYQHFALLPASRLDGQSAVVGGFVSSIPEKSGNLYHYTLDTHFVSAENAPQKLKLNVYSLYPPKAGETVYLEAKLSIPNKSYGFDGTAYYRSKGIYLTAFSYSDLTVSPQTTYPIRRFFLKLREKLANGYSELFVPDEAAIARALLLGDKSLLSAERYRQYRAAGLAHILATSGIHTSVLIFAAYGLLRKLHVKIRPACLITAVLVLVYMALVGFLPSVTRAGLMALLMLTARALFTRTDFANSLGFAAWIMVTVSPFCVLDISFQLSFMATLGICLCTPHINNFSQRVCAKRSKRTGRLLNILIQSVGTGTAASLFVLPLSMTYFETISTVSVPSTLLATPLLTLILPLLAICALFLCLGLFGWPVRIFASGAAFLIRIMTAIAKAFSALPFAELPADYRLISAAITVCTIFAAALLLYQPLRRYTAILCCTCALIFCVSTCATALWNRNTLSVMIFPSEKGSCVLLKSGRTTLSFGGSSDYQTRSAAKTLRGIGTDRIDYLLFADDALKSSWELYGIEVGETYASEIGRRIDTITVPFGDFAVLIATDDPDGFSVTIETPAKRMILLTGGDTPDDTPADFCILLNQKAHFDGTCTELYCTSAQNITGQNGFLMSDDQILSFRITKNDIRRTNTVF